MNPQRPDHDTLMAYADGQLDAARSAEVDRYLEYEARLALNGDAPPHGARSSVSAEIAALQAQNLALREALAPMLDEPVPRACCSLSRRLRALGTRGGRGVVDRRGRGGRQPGHPGGAAAKRPVVTAQNEGMQHFVHQAELAYAVYTPDARRPVEVREGSDLTTWLSRRLQRPIVAPTPCPAAWCSWAAACCPACRAKPAAQLMYQDAQGHRVTVYLRGMAKPTAEISFRIVAGKPASTFIGWIANGATR
jgi:Predicted transmembrane transcriptional regulator (anti-sigma factor)